MRKNVVYRTNMIYVTNKARESARDGSVFCEIGITSQAREEPRDGKVFVKYMGRSGMLDTKLAPHYQCACLISVDQGKSKDI